MRLVLAIAMSALPALPAGAVPHPCYVDQEVADGVTVVQIVDQVVTGPDPNGDCTLAGTVARSFRGHLRVGTVVQTSFACGYPINVDNNGVVVIEPGTFYRDEVALAQAGAVEIHVGESGYPAAAGAGLVALDALTDEIMYPFEDLLAAGGSCD